MSLEVCEEGHEAICYTKTRWDPECPLCAAIEKIGLLENQVTSLGAEAEDGEAESLT